ncbi:unnamed protein product [Symbiodinium necroappetens]|uniref:Uncharacterized protein n=1 Tax=Symbiodinium necroappetens TaxID=1628268 RepID=A0A813ARP6_9DINO|nr:unnamed protein product [Symbiodinium necroappetens]
MADGAGRGKKFSFLDGSFPRQHGKAKGSGRQSHPSSAARGPRPGLDQAEQEAASMAGLDQRAAAFGAGLDQQTAAVAGNPGSTSSRFGPSRDRRVENRQGLMQSLISMNTTMVQERQALRIAKEEMAEKHRIAMEQAQDDFEQQIQKAVEVARCEERQIAEAERRELVAEHERSLKLAQDAAPRAQDSYENARKAWKLVEQNYKNLLAAKDRAVKAAESKAENFKEQLESAKSTAEAHYGIRNALRQEVHAQAEQIGHLKTEVQHLKAELTAMDEPAAAKKRQRKRNGASRTRNTQLRLRSELIRALQRSVDFLLLVLRLFFARPSSLLPARCSVPAFCFWLLLFPFAMASAEDSIILDFSNMDIPGPFDSDRDEEFSNDGDSSDDHIEPWVRYPKPGGIGKSSDGGMSEVTDGKSVADGTESSAGQAGNSLDGKPSAVKAKAKAQAKAASDGKPMASAGSRETPAAPHDNSEMPGGTPTPEADEKSQRAQAILAYYNGLFGRNDFVFIDADGGFHCAEPAEDDVAMRS